MLAIHNNIFASLEIHSYSPKRFQNQPTAPELTKKGIHVDNAGELEHHSSSPALEGWFGGSMLKNGFVYMRWRALQALNYVCHNANCHSTHCQSWPNTNPFFCSELQKNHTDRFVSAGLDFNKRSFPKTSFHLGNKNYGEIEQIAQKPTNDYKIHLQIAN